MNKPFTLSILIFYVLLLNVCYAFSAISEKVSVFDENCMLFAQKPGKLSSTNGNELSKECLYCFKESIGILKLYGDNIWKSFSQTNIRVNIITESFEYFFGDQIAPQGYELLSEESIIGKPIWYKKREYRHTVISNINRIGDKPALFISSKEVFEKIYAKSPLYKIAEDYIFTILQQYYHLYQMQNEAQFSHKSSIPQYEIIKLKNSYPYFDFINSKLLEIEGNELLDALKSKEQDTIKEHVANFLRLKFMRQKQIKNDYKLDFTPFENWFEWYDGNAKYTEIEFSKLIISEHHKPYQGMFNVRNFKNYGFAANKLKFELDRLKFGKNPLIHSAIGMIEALLLDKLDDSWKEKALEPDVFLVDFLGESVDLTDYLKK